MKQNYDCIIVARKPCNGTCVDNVIQYGVGGINIDECRIGTDERENPQAGFIRRGRTDEEVFMGVDKNKPEGTLTVIGRFPANLILTYDDDDYEDICGGFPDSKGARSQNVFTTSNKYGGNSLLNSSTKRFNYQLGYNDDGSASRYFYNAQYTQKDDTSYFKSNGDYNKHKMKLYCENEHYKLYNGNMLDMLEVIPLNSVDAVVTDPPYELNFMNRSWDATGIAFQKTTWEKCFKVLKPGGYLLAFGGSRTFHRIACAIEDAGFEIRDTIMWLYGCLSEDTEVLTDHGFKYFKDINDNDKIRIYDIESGVYKWEKPERWNVYKVKSDTCYRIKSDSTDQLVSRNHRCLVERDGKLVFKYAEELNDMERVPVLSYNIPFIQKGQGNILFSDMLWQDERLAEKLFCEWVGNKEPKEISLWGNKPSVERWSDISSSERELYISEHKICEVSRGIYNDGEKRWICNGTSTDSGSTNTPTTIENGSGTSYQSQCGGQQTGKSDVICNEQRPQNVRGWETYTTTLATVSAEEYTGIIFCPTVSTGAFVARRNGMVFITGNSGFPKSQNLGKSIEAKLTMGTANTQAFTKLNGTKAEKGNWGIAKMAFNHGARPSNHDDNGNLRTVDVEYTTELGKAYSGWGTSLKPAYEPVIVARKPCEGSTTDNVIKYGVGGINIDECRIGVEERTYKGMSSKKPEGAGCFRDDNWQPKDIENTVNGRFPSNLILTYDETDKEEVCGGFPEGGKNGSISHPYKMNNQVYGDYGYCNTWEAYDDSGSASRYFYCAKASRRDRDCDGTIRNIHPTCKPCDLMQYLVRLVTPNGGTVLDPFNGSGSTGKAVMYENKDHNKNYKYIGIELTDEYLPISKARIDYAIGDTTDYSVENIAPEKKTKENDYYDIWDELE